jgi:hypothetical protein
MGFTVKMCNDFAKKIINEIFWIKYKHTIKDNNTWYENLNNFLVKEWDILQESENTENELMDDEEDMIIRDAMDFLLDKLNVDEDEFEEHEQDVDWRRFDDIIGYYTCII